MEIIVTLEEVFATCDDWKQFCKEENWDEKSIVAGYGDVKITLTKQACFKYGILKMYE